MNRYLAAFGLAACLLAAPALADSPTPADKHAHVSLDAPFQVELFREALIDLSERYEQAFSLREKTSEEIRKLNSEQMQMLYEALNHDGRFLETALEVIDRMAHAELTTRPGSATKTKIFDPLDYPPTSGGYFNQILGPLIGSGLTTSASSRCSNSAYGDAFELWYPAQKTYEALESSCVVAGCDPTGIVCAAACTLVAIPRALAVGFALPIELCDVHNGTVDSAEIQGAYENSVALFRTKIEENLMLSAPDFTIASMQIPEAFGGNLNLVDTVVQEAMNNMIAAGGSINLAQIFFNQAQTHATNGNYKQAYLMYRRAYKEVVKLP